MSKDNDKRYRNWLGVVYPDSAPENWREIIDELHISWFESPLHEYDFNPDGTQKKPHWHVVFQFSGKKSYEQILEIMQKVNGPIPQPCHNTTGAVRYLIHMDNPEKYQYSVSGIIGHGGADPTQHLAPTEQQLNTILSDMITYISTNHVTELMDFIEYCQKERFDDWFPVATRKATFFLDKVIRSEKYRRRTTKKKVVDIETGEVIEAVIENTKEGSESE